MNELALISIGFGLGICLAVVAGMVLVLYFLSQRAIRSIESSLAEVRRALDLQTTGVDLLRTDMTQIKSDVTFALARIDSDRLYAASQTMQRSAKSLAASTDTLQRALFAQPATAPPPALDLYGLDDEAAEDARLAADRDRWAALREADPLAGLTPEERERRVSQFFADRRAQRQPVPGSGNLDDIHPVGASPGAPPSFGSGAYAKLAEQAAALQAQPAREPAPDFSGAVADEGAEAEGDTLNLSDKGELG